MQEPKEGLGRVIVEDMALAGYMIMRGVEMINVDVSNGKARFEFSTTEEERQRFYISFINNECKLFDSVMRDLKNIIKQKRG